MGIGVCIFISNLISVGSEQPADDKVPLLMPVKAGINWIWSPKCQKALLLKDKFQYLRYHKCISHCKSDLHAVWHLIARMNDQGDIQIENGTDAWKYNLDALGFLKIRNVSVDDNGTEYKCEVRKWDLDSEHIVLLYYGLQEAAQSTNTTCRTVTTNDSYPESGNNSVGKNNSGPGINNKGPENKSDDPDGGVSCRCTGWKIGFGAAIFFAVFSLLGLAWAVRKFRQPIQDGVAPEIANVENAGDVIENRNVNRSQKCDSRGTPDDEDDVPMVLLS